MRPVRAVVFDLDGTLVDSLDDIVSAANFALAAHGHAELSRSELAGYVGDGARRLLSRAARIPESGPELDGLLATFLGRYTAHATDHTRLMPGAAEALAALRSLPLALCTNKPRPTTDAVLDALALAPLFRCVIADGDVARKKPDPEALVTIAARLGVRPEELAMVGDGPQDIECGRAAGARTIGVLGGIASRERLVAARPDAVIHSLAELPALIDSWR